MSYAENTTWRKRVAELALPQLFNHRLIRVTRKGDDVVATLRNELTSVEQTLQARQIVVEHGTEPATDVYNALRAASANDGVTDLRALVNGAAQPVGTRAGYSLHRIGDAVSNRNIHTAILDATRLLCAL